MKRTGLRAGRALVWCAMVCVSAPSVRAQGEAAGVTHARLAWFRAIPGALAASGRDVARRERVPVIATTIGATAVLFAFDEQIYRGATRVGRTFDVSANHPEWAWKVGDAKLFYLPTTFASGLYYLGDGWTTMAVAGGFFATGKLRGSARAVRTASEIAQSMVALGLVTQAIKHATGRQTPGASTATRGRWQPFAGWSAYSANTPNYDAFPSGHLATAMSTVTVIAANYPENPWVRPLGYSLMTALAFAMVNNGVHWSSDYPPALLIGGTVGAMVARQGRAPAQERSGERLTLTPHMGPTSMGVDVHW
jgi:hypothetical protein